MERGDVGINELDKACREHDIAYNQTTDRKKRNISDHILAGKAWNRFKSPDASLGERATALGVASIMKTKAKLGMGVSPSKRKRKRVVKHKEKGQQQYPKTGGCLRKNCRKRKRKPIKRGKGVGGVKKKRGRPRKASKKNVKKIYRNAVSSARKQIKSNKPSSLNEATKIAIDAAKHAVKVNGGITRKEASQGLPRIIPVPKIGGVLPLIPIFAGLSALGALAGGSASVANAVVNAKNAKKKFNEAKRHNETLEAIALGKSPKMGSGLFLSPYKKAYGLYLSPYNSDKSSDSMNSKN